MVHSLAVIELIMKNTCNTIPDGVWAEQLIFNMRAPS